MDPMAKGDWRKLTPIIQAKVSSQKIFGILTMELR
jgi:hypothetical protein